MKVLVLTSEAITSAQLREALGGDVEPEHTEVMVVAPALAQSPLKFWVGDADEAISRAEQVRHETLQELGQDGVAASGDTGESDPLEAIADALRTFPAERLVLFTHREPDRRSRADLHVEEVRARFGLPVDQATVEGSAD